jgi:hypothetical protein
VDRLQAEIAKAVISLAQEVHTLNPGITFSFDLDLIDDAIKEHNEAQTMTRKRWDELSFSNDHPTLTLKEIDQGWHWCSDWDGLLVGPGMDEMDSCPGHGGEE